MHGVEPRFFATAQEFRAWLEANHEAATELLVGFYKKASGRPSGTWAESVDEALCFGWIDGVRRGIDVSPAGAALGGQRQAPGDAGAAADRADRGFRRGPQDRPTAPVIRARLVCARWRMRSSGELLHMPDRGVRARSRVTLALASREYVFVDEWDVAAAPAAVFHAISEARTYPQWWKPVYVAVEADGEVAVGKESRQHFKGRLPYHLHTRSRVTRLEPPRVIEADIDGDLRGHGKWTLTEIPVGTHVRFDWQVFADRPLLRVFTPILRPAFRWNHAWAIARAREGLEPYAQALVV